MPLLPLILHQKIVTDVDAPENSHDIEEVDGGHGISNEAAEVQQTKVRNRRKRYLDANPDYLGPSLELAGRHSHFYSFMYRCLITVDRSLALR